MNNKKNTLWVTLVLMGFLMCAQSYGQSDPWNWLDMWKSKTVKGTGDFPLPVFAIDTTHNSNLAPPTPFTASWLYFAGTPAAGGQFARCLATESAQYGLNLPNATTDSFHITLTLYFGADGRHVLGKFASNTGWYITIGSELGARYIEWHMGGATTVKIDEIAVADTSWHTYDIYYWKATTTLDAYTNGVLSYHNASYTHTAASHIYSFTLGLRGTPNSTSDTNQVGAGSHFKGGMKMPMKIVRYSGGVDTTYNFGMNGYGQEIWCDVSTGGTHISGWAEYDRANYTGSLPLSYHMQLGYGQSIDRRDPLWVNTGTAPTYIRTMNGGVAGFMYGNTNNIFRERFFNGEGIWVKRDSTFVVFLGAFNKINWTSINHPIGGDSANGIAKFNIDSETWTGFNQSQYPTGSLYTGVQYDTGFIAGGDMTGFQGVALTNGIARFDGTNWNAIDSGFNTNVSCVRVRVLKDTLYAGGAFGKSGNTTLGGIGKLVNNVWTGFGSGTNGTVWDMIIFNNELIIGGDFSTANGVACNSIAKWNGTTFVPYGNGVKNGAGNGIVFCFAIYKGELYAGGKFDTIAGVPCSKLFKYNGTTFTAVGTGIQRGILTDGDVIDMKVDSTYNHLYVIGQFTYVNGRIMDRGFMFDGTNFQPLPPQDKRAEGFLITGNGTANIRYWSGGDAEGVYGHNVGCVFELIPPR